MVIAWQYMQTDRPKTASVSTIYGVSSGPLPSHYENKPIQIYWKFHHQKLKFWYFSNFCSKHRLWVLVRTTLSRQFYRVHTIYVLSKNKKNNVYPCKPQFYCIKVGFKLYRYVFVMPALSCHGYIFTVYADRQCLSQPPILRSFIRAFAIPALTELLPCTFTIFSDILNIGTLTLYHTYP